MKQKKPIQKAQKPACILEEVPIPAISREWAESRDGVEWMNHIIYFDALIRSRNRYKTV